MDIATLNSTLAGVGVLAALLFVVAVVLILRRTGSSHVLTYRLWRWATDRQDVKDEKSQAFLDEQHAIMAFRFVSGLRVRTLEQAHTLIDYLKTNEIDVTDARVSGAYLDSAGTGIEVKPAPREWARWLQFLAAAVFLWVTLVALGGRLVINDAWLWFKSTDTAFMLSPEKAKRWGSFQPLTSSDCKSSKPVHATGFSPDETRSLCELFDNPSELNSFYTKAIVSQKTTFTFLAGIFAFFTWQLAAGLEQWQAAIRVASSLNRKHDRSVHSGAVAKNRIGACRQKPAPSR